MMNLPPDSVPDARGGRMSPLAVGVLVVLVVAALVVGGFLTLRAAAQNRAEEARVSAAVEEYLRTGEVVYEVEGDGEHVYTADVTLRSLTGTVQGTPDMPMVPKAGGGPGMTYEFGRGEFLYVSAQKKTALGSITCRITVDGEIVSENTSTAAYGIATCEGTS